MFQNINRIKMDDQRDRIIEVFWSMQRGRLQTLLRDSENAYETGDILDAGNAVTAVLVLNSIR